MERCRRPTSRPTMPMCHPAPTPSPASNHTIMSVYPNLARPHYPPPSPASTRAHSRSFLPLCPPARESQAGKARRRNPGETTPRACLSPHHSLLLRALLFLDANPILQSPLAD
ncbi:hypothetical protein DENSPDRAFT_205966 [Dentipellis sp. KUC8613]|nr:hypothetical protein DENSPDRAFT_205966 [Dentipellis sp. KUC8613]